MTPPPPPHPPLPFSLYFSCNLPIYELKNADILQVHYQTRFSVEGTDMQQRLPIELALPTNVNGGFCATERNLTEK